MTRRQAQHDYQDDSYDDDEEYDIQRITSHRTTQAAPHPAESLVHRAFDWGISGSILAIIVLTVLYTLSPVGVIPDIVPTAGQVDDLAAILAGSSSVAALAVVRYILRSRIGQITCLVAIVLSAIGAFAVFWALMELFDRLL